MHFKRTKGSISRNRDTFQINKIGKTGLCKDFLFWIVPESKGGVDKSQRSECHSSEENGPSSVKEHLLDC